jgi:hypothetical protein
LVRNPEIERLVGKPEYSWKDFSRMDLKETVVEDINLTEQCVERSHWLFVVNKGFIKCGEIFGKLSDC